MNEKPQVIFADGMILKDRHPNCPDYVKATIAFKVEDFMRTLQQHAINGWLTVNLKVSQSGKKYFQVDTWQPQTAQPQQPPQPQYQTPYQQPPAPPQYQQPPVYGQADQIPGLPGDDTPPF